MRSRKPPSDHVRRPIVSLASSPTGRRSRDAKKSERCIRALRARIPVIKALANEWREPSVGRREHDRRR